MVPNQRWNRGAIVFILEMDILPNIRNRKNKEMEEKKMSNNKKRYARISLVLITILALTLLGGCGDKRDSKSNVDNEVVAETAYGQYIGLTRESGVVSFLGVPYAKQPLGELRWKEPQPLEKSNEFVRAYDFGKTAIQPIDEFERASFAEQGEDCLSLNVWTKEVTEKKPTMVFIHGGANVSGGSSDPMYHGEKFVENNDVVMVSINHRLGAFGFLDLSEIGGNEFANSRNVGVLDQIAALKWVKENIESFGGDPENITVFGESAGGSAIIRIMSTPLAEGLFQKAIIQSGGQANIKINGEDEIDQTKQSREIAGKFAELTGKKTVEELQQLTATEVQNYSNELADALGDSLDISTWGAVADDYAVPLDVFGNIKDGTGADVKVMIGTNADEMNYFKLYDSDLENSLIEEYKNGTTLGKDFSKNKEAADNYMEAQKDNPQRYVDFCGEYWLRQPSMIFAELQSKYNDVFMYEWAWDSNVEGLGACHAVELPFVLGNFDSATAVSYAGENLPEELALKTQAAWAAFATTGNPSIDGEANWPQYTLEKRATMMIDDAPWKVVNDPKPDARKYMREMYSIGE